MYHHEWKKLQKFAQIYSEKDWRDKIDRSIDLQENTRYSNIHSKKELLIQKSVSSK